MNIHEMYGRQAETAQQLREFYDKTMQLLREVRAGAVLPSQLVVNESGWELQDAPVEEAKEEEDGTESQEPTRIA